ncbi:ER membrane protein complex subunit 1 isoform X2 [Eupeodes corollae]|uniref:ER membrane protein complex subunit 1 isoform X2 n=1 Tax=Eupeodes corollae TaxID=290404 RepID=UPI0024934FF3|nr:ER membrane protein complex subunit 1 isoform X2 [Eupeodes corollae]
MKENIQMSLKIISNFTIILFGLLCIQHTNGLYEDQIKKFDWRNQHIGNLISAYLDLGAPNSRLLVTTSENVFASLCPKTGDIQWRQIFEKSPRGDIKFSYNFNEQLTGTAAARRNSNHNFDLLTVQGVAPAIVRGWNAASGNIEWEWSLMPINPDKADGAFWFFSNAMLYHVIPLWGSHLEITRYFATSGQLADTSTTKIIAPWIDREKCIQAGFYYSCLEGSQLISLNLVSTDANIIKKQLPSVPKSKPHSLKGEDGIIVIEGQLVSVDDSVKVCPLANGGSYIKAAYNQMGVLLQATLENHMLTINAFNAKTCDNIKELQNAVPYPVHYGQPTLQTFDCVSGRNDGKGCAFVLSTSDEAILTVQQNKIRWAREESLANIVAVEFIDLPLADEEGAIESEMKNKPGDIAGAFIRRITGQSALAKSLFLHVMGFVPKQTDTQKAGLVRDSFGLHKMLVVLTKAGKLFGIDNISSKKHWMQYLPTLGNFENEQNMRLIVQRTSKHFPLQPMCAVVARNIETGNGVVFSFNPITGKPTSEGLISLNYQIKQMSMLRENENDFVKGILLMDQHNVVHVVPSNSKSMADGMYIFTAEKSSAELNGYLVKLVGNELKTLPIWNARLGGHSGEHQIIAVASKNPIERVHSQGRVLNDRSVMYKYMNPNLVAVVTQALDSIHKYIMNVHLIDVVSGQVVFSMTHRKVRGPFNIVHSENWLAYSYYNDKVRRTEITTIELYESKTQTNSTVWSSLNAPTLPLVERQSYIIPTSVETLKETITERGITNKHVLLGTSSGAIVEMPWVLLDPRRPITMPNQAREEGSIPYIPELPLPTENIVNYNQTIARIRNIFTAPSGLESTCLVVATGLDLFVTRVSPSKTFDLLKEDFDYFLITIVLIALTTSSLVVKHLSARKILKQAWK